MSTEEMVIEAIMSRQHAASGVAVYVDPVVLRLVMRPLTEERDRLRTALHERALVGVSRPAAVGIGDDGDGWWKNVAYDLISRAASALAPEGKVQP
jgi:hypothetical protein